LVSGSDTLVFPWAGDRALSSLATILTTEQREVSHDGVTLALPEADPADVLDLLGDVLASDPVDPVELAAKVPAKAAEKHDWMLTDELLNMAFASRSLDVPGAYAAASRVIERSNVGGA
jgi:ATP-dependent Lhr-like helicase